MEHRDENKEGIGGMINPRRYGIERVAYILMRLSGLGLLAYFIGHIPITIAKIACPSVVWVNSKNSPQPISPLSIELVS